MENTTEKFKPKRGDKVLVWDDYEEYVEECIFLTEIEGAKYPYNCVSVGDEEDFINGYTFYNTSWTNIKPIPEKEIAKDTLVWVKNHESSLWQQRFYSHFENGKHYCFIEQKKSSETKDVVFWEIVTDKNPFE